MGKIMNQLYIRHLEQCRLLCSRLKMKNQERLKSCALMVSIFMLCRYLINVLILLVDTYEKNIFTHGEKLYISKLYSFYKKIYYIHSSTGIHSFDLLNNIFYDLYRKFYL